MKKTLRNMATWLIAHPGLRTAVKAGKLCDYIRAKKMLGKERAGKIKPKDNLAIIAMFRNEAPYLAEWIEYHKLMGVDRFYLFDNESTDDPIPVLLPHIKDGTVVYQMLSDNEASRLMQTYGSMPKRHIAHHLALEQCRMTAKWVAVIDIDEFILPKLHSNIPQFLSSFQNASQIILGWNCFGSDGHKTKPGGLVIESYLRRGAIPDSRAFKAIANPRAIVVDRNHYHAVAGKTVDETGKIIRHKMHEYPAPSNICPINHYITRSRAECLDKCAKNKTMNGGRYGEDFFAKYDRNDTGDRAMLKHAKRVKQALYISLKA